MMTTNVSTIAHTATVTALIGENVNGRSDDGLLALNAFLCLALFCLLVSLADLNILALGKAYLYSSSVSASSPYSSWQPTSPNVLRPLNSGSVRKDSVVVMWPKNGYACYFNFRAHNLDEVSSYPR
jgi:hypothetical protein